jgi:maleamate amidohydrolase
VDVTTPFGGALGWGRRPALVLIDMMRAYFTAGSPFDLGSRAAVDGCAALLAAARSAGVPVLHTRVQFGADLSDGGLFVRKVPALAALVEGAELGRFVPELTPVPGEVIVVKQYASAFFGTSLAATLTARGVDTTVIAGVSTSGCVRASATDALQHGFRPVVVGDACGDRTAAVHDANLFDLNAKYADVTTVESAVAQFAACR